MLATYSFDRHSFGRCVGVLHRRARRAIWAVAPFLLALAIGLSVCNFAQGLIVGSEPGFAPDTSTNPINYPGWTQGDPGWSNVSVDGSNYVYLGDGWVLSARHVGYSDTAGIQFQTMLPDGSPGTIEAFHRIPGSYYLDYGHSANGNQYAVSNPTSIQAETGQTISLADSLGTHFTDLQLFRIDGDPGLPSLTVASQPLPSDFTRIGAPEVVAVGNGNGRHSPEGTWYVTKNNSDWTWSQSPPGEVYQGYLRNNTTAKRFGTNRLADPRPNFSGDPSDPGAKSYTDLFEAVISDTTAILQLQTGSVTRDVIALMTVYDRQTDPGATSLEFQGTSGGSGFPGNSGSAIFHNRGTEAAPQWELIGIMNAIFRFEDQPGAWSIYGNTTLISDLWYYTQDYPNSIKDIIDSHPDYSVMGDLNLDGIVAGDGTGPADADDVAAFVAGWGYSNGLGLGTITSWKNGDLNRDGTTDVDDFLMLRDTLNGPVSSAALTALFGAGAVVPEPSALLLALISAGLLPLATRRRR